MPGWSQTPSTAAHGLPSERGSAQLKGLSVGFLALLGAGALWWAGGSRSPQSELVLYGNVDVREVQLAFNEGDRIVTVHVEEGDAVEAGQLLAELDRSRLESLVREIEAKVAAQRAVVARYEHGSRPPEIARARAEVEGAAADLADARVTRERIEDLARAEVVSPQELDNARAAHRTARARLEVARENLRLAVEGPRSEDIEAARAQLRADESSLKFTRHRLADTKLFAPTAGTVLTRILEPGAVVLPNTPVVTLAVADPVWVRAYVAERDLGRVVPGMEAEIVSDSFPDRPHRGWVGFISPTAEFTPKPVETPDLRTSLVYRARIYVRNPDSTLRQGMPVTVHLLPDAAEDGQAPGRSAPAGARPESEPSGGAPPDETAERRGRAVP